MNNMTVSPLSHEKILAGLPAQHPWRETIQYFTSIDSTNAKAKALALSGAPHGTVLIADAQTGGKGRMGRSFHSPAGAGIYLSVLLRPQCPPAQLMHLTCAAANAMCDAIETATGIHLGIKWTNDLVLGQKKVGGILTELLINSNGKDAAAIIGIGINCTQREADFPPELQSIAASLASISQQAVDRSALAASMITSLCQMDKDLLTKRAETLDRYRANCVTLGKDISLLRGGEVRHGRALDVDDSGALLVEFTDGTRQYVNSGEVSVRGMYGYL